MPVQPVITLEVLKQRQANAVVLITYATVIFATIMAVYEENLRYDQTPVAGNYCQGGNTNACTAVFDNYTVWQTGADFDQLQLYFSLSVTVTRSSSSTITPAMLPALDLPFVANVTLLGVPSHPDSFNDSLPQLLFFGSSKFQLTCDEGSGTCEQLNLLTESEYQYALVRQYERFNVSVMYQWDTSSSSWSESQGLQFDLLKYGQPQYFFIYHDTTFKYAELCSHAIFLAITVCATCYWVYRLHRLGYANTLREQIWISLLLVTLIFYQDPFFVPLALNQVRYLWLLSSSSEMLSVGSILLFWLLLINGMPHPQSRLGFADFYLWKLVLFVVFTVCTQVLVFLTDSVVWTGASNDLTADLTDSHDAGYVASLFMLVVAALTILWWLVWFFVSMYRTSGRLRVMSYVSTRFRQLSFRFFVIQSVMVVLYFIAFAIVRVVRRSVFFGIYSESYATFVLVSVYITLLAFIYLPAPNFQPALLLSKAGTGAVSVQAVAPKAAAAGSGMEESLLAEHAHDYLAAGPDHHADKPNAKRYATGGGVDVDPSSTLPSRFMQPPLADDSYRTLGDDPTPAPASPPPNPPRMPHSLRVIGHDSGGRSVYLTDNPDEDSDYVVVARGGGGGGGGGAPPATSVTVGDGLSSAATGRTGSGGASVSVSVGMGSALDDDDRMERDVRDPEQLTEKFSLPRAYWLSFFAYQAYYDAPDFRTTMSSYGELDLLSQFGYKVVKPVSNSETDAHCIIARKHNRLVIAFRGTVSHLNIRTDLTFGRVALPPSVTGALPPHTIQRNPKIHSGFWRAYSSLRQGVLGAVSEILHELKKQHDLLKQELRQQRQYKRQQQQQQRHAAVTAVTAAVPSSSSSRAAQERFPLISEHEEAMYGTMESPTVSPTHRALQPNRSRSKGSFDSDQGGSQGSDQSPEVQPLPPPEAGAVRLSYHQGGSPAPGGVAASAPQPAAPGLLFLDLGLDDDADEKDRRKERDDDADRDVPRPTSKAAVTAAAAGDDGGGDGFFSHEHGGDDSDGETSHTDIPVAPAAAVVVTPHRDDEQHHNVLSQSLDAGLARARGISGHRGGSVLMDDDDEDDEEEENENEGEEDRKRQQGASAGPTSRLASAARRLLFSSGGDGRKAKKKARSGRGRGGGRGKVPSSPSLLSTMLEAIVPATYVPESATSLHSELLHVSVCGHSMGGALAMLCALELSTQLQLKCEVYTYGAPRVGNHDFASLYTVHVPRTFRVCFDRDIITTLPKLVCMYKHVGMEVIVDRYGNFIVDPLYVEKLFRGSRMSLNDHRLMQYMMGLRQGCEMYGFHPDFKMPAPETFAREERKDMLWAEEQGVEPVTGVPESVVEAARATDEIDPLTASVPVESALRTQLLGDGGGGDNIYAAGADDAERIEPKHAFGTRDVRDFV